MYRPVFVTNNLSLHSATNAAELEPKGMTTIQVASNQHFHWSFLDGMAKQTHTMTINLLSLHSSLATVAALLESATTVYLGGGEQRVCRRQTFVTVLCKRLKLSNISFLTSQSALFTASLEVSTFPYLAQTTNNGTSGSFSNRTPTSLVLLYTTYTRESQLARRPRL